MRERSNHLNNFEERNFCELQLLLLESMDNLWMDSALQWKRMWILARFPWVRKIHEQITFDVAQKCLRKLQTFYLKYLANLLFLLLFRQYSKECTNIWESTGSFQARYEEKNGLHVCSIHGKIGYDLDNSDEVSCTTSHYDSLNL